MQSYLNITHGNLERALELYKWNSEISVEVFRVLADVEVFLCDRIAHRESIHGRDFAGDYEICMNVLKSMQAIVTIVVLCTVKI